MSLFPNFIKKPSSLSLSPRFLTEKSKSSWFHDERLSPFVEVNQFSFGTYTTNDIIAGVVKYLESSPRSCYEEICQELVYQGPPMYPFIWRKEGWAVLRQSVRRTRMRKCSPLLESKPVWASNATGLLLDTVAKVADRRSICRVLNAIQIAIVFKPQQEQRKLPNCLVCEEIRGIHARREQLRQMMSDKRIRIFRSIRSHTV